MIKRADNYNRAIDFIEKEPVDCTLEMIATPDSFAVGRVTTDLNKLDAG